MMEVRAFAYLEDLEASTSVFGAIPKFVSRMSLKSSGRKLVSSELVYPYVHWLGRLV